jgi:hypothetical protein
MKLAGWLKTFSASNSARYAATWVSEICSLAAAVDQGVYKPVAGGVRFQHDGDASACPRRAEGATRKRTVQ